MPEVPSEAFNPLAPEQEKIDARKANYLSNDDFRRLLTTPRASSIVNSTVTTSTTKERRVSAEKGDDKKQKKRSLYSKFKKEEEERELEWAKKYRDRAKERRDNKNPDYSKIDEALPSSSSYRAVAPGLVDSTMVAERRKQAIVESKFLGGDIQHTHLVKGLDYVLLDKVRGEITSKDEEVKDDGDFLKRKERERVKSEAADDLKFNSTLGKNIYRALFLSQPPLKNDLFSPGRMAYVFEMDDDGYSESDIPTVLIRSVADCPIQESATLTTNDIVINKLTQILSYLRQGTRPGKKSKKKEKLLIPSKTQLS